MNFSEVTTTLNRNGFCKSNLTIKLNASPFKIKLCDSALFGHLKHISRRSKNADNLTDEERRVEECERQRIANGRQQGRYSAETDIVYSEVLSILYPSRWGVESELVAKSKERVPPNDIPWLHSNFHPSRNALTKKGDLSNDEVSPNLPLVRQQLVDARRWGLCLQLHANTGKYRTLHVLKCLSFPFIVECSTIRITSIGGIFLSQQSQSNIKIHTYNIYTFIHMWPHSHTYIIQYR